MARVNGEGVDREERARDRGERGREPVHVVEQVERVRHSDQPEDADHRGRDVVADDLDPDAAGRGRAPAAPSCAPIFASGERRKRSSSEAGEEEDRAAAEDAAELARGRDEAGRERDADGGEEAGHDAAAAEERRRARVPAVLLRRGDDVTRRRGVQEPPDRQEARRQRGKGSHGDRHAISVTKRCMDGVWDAGCARLARCAAARDPPLPLLPELAPRGRGDARLHRLRAHVRARARRDPADAARGAPRRAREAPRGRGLAREGARGGLVRARRHGRRRAPVRESRARLERPELARERPFVRGAPRPLHRGRNAGCACSRSALRRRGLRASGSSGTASSSPPTSSSTRTSASAAARSTATSGACRPTARICRSPTRPST